MNYNYIYLDPRRPTNINIILGEKKLELNYLPIYVGVGVKKRYTTHIKYAKKLLDNSIKVTSYKSNILKKILKECNMSDEYYIKNFILVFNHNKDRNKCLIVEKYLVEWIGTKYEVYMVPKRGILSNVLRGGVANPINYGLDNGFFGKSHSKESIEKWKQSMKSFYSTYGSTYSYLKKHNPEKYMECINKIRKKKVEFINNHPHSQLSMIAKKGAESRRKFCLEYPEICSERRKKRLKKFKNTIKNRTSEDKENISKKLKEAWNKKVLEDPMWYIERNKSVSKSSKNWWSNMTEDQRKDYLNKRKKSIDKYWSNYWQDEEIRNLRLSKNIFHKKKKELTEDEYKLWCKDKNGGENNPMYGKGHLVKGSKNGRAKIYFIKQPDGKEYICYGNMKHYKMNHKQDWLLAHPGKKQFRPNIFAMSEADQNKHGWKIQRITKEEYIKNYNMVELYENI